MKNKSLFQKIWQEPSWPDRSEWKEILGFSVKWVPPHLWEERMFFKGADDLELKKLTKSFPSKLNNISSSHPIYILQVISNFAHRLCPCSSQRHSDTFFIKKGCKLQYTGYRMDRDSYILEWIEFRLPNKQSDLIKRLEYKGIVPQKCLQRN